MKRLGIGNMKLPATRSGTSLGEVVVSLLVMSIGVTLLAMLFPISILRSVQATQMTNATNLRYNVEALLGAKPQLFSIATSWQSGYAYAAGAYVTPTELTSLKSPPCVFVCTVAGSSGPLEPAWNYNNLATTVEVVTPPTTPAQWKTYLLQNYVIDPLGEVLIESTYRNTADGDYFGNFNGTPNHVVGTTNGVRAFSGFSSVPTVSQADDLATLPDSYELQLESNVVSATTLTNVTLADVKSAVSISYPTSTAAATDPMIYYYPPSRIILFDSVGKVSHARPIYSITGTLPSLTFDWSPPGPPAPPVLSSGPLPVNFVPARARVETKDRRYTWMLSVRRGYSGTSYLDVVVFYKRPFSGKDEQLYPTTFSATTDLGYDGAPGILGVDDNNDGVTDNNAEIGWPGSDDVSRNWVVVQYDASGSRPFVKKGGYVTDADNLRWYRITNVVEGDTFYGYTPTSVLTKAGITAASLNPNYPVDSAAGATFKSIFLRLEAPIAQTGPQPVGGIPSGNAMLMRGIVEVYPIRTQLSWND